MRRRSRFFKAGVGLATLIFLLPASALAVVPPPQSHVAGFGGQTVFMAPENFDFPVSAGNFTVEMWAYVDRPTAGAGLIGRVNINELGLTRGFVMQLGDEEKARLWVWAQGPDGVGSMHSDGPVPIQQWFHVGVVRNTDDVLRMYINGVEQWLAPHVATIWGNTPWFVGAVTNNPPASTNFNGFYGLLRQVRLWSKALSAQELLGVAQALPALDAEGLLAWWPLDDGTGQQARDLGPHGHHLMRGIEPGIEHRDPRWRQTAAIDSGPYFEYMDELQLLPDTNTPRIVHGRVLDANGDGNLDVFLVRTRYGDFPRAPSLVALGDGQGGLRDGTSEVLPEGNVWTYAGLPALVADVNGDGRSDLFLSDGGPDKQAGPGGQDRLLLRHADGTLRDATDSNFPIKALFTHSLCGGDFNADGHVDVVLGTLGGGRTFLPTDSATRVLFNDGTGKFRRELRLPWERGPFAERRPPSGWGCAVLDANGDGFDDIVIGSGGGGDSQNDQDMLLLNDGQGNFALAPHPLPARITSPLGTTQLMRSADFNADGIPDLVGISTEADQNGERPFLWLGIGDGRFVDASVLLPIPERPWGSGPLIADFDGNGLPDLLLPGEIDSSPFQVFLNLDGCRWIDGTDFFPSGLLPTDVGDMNNDGLVDVIVLNGPQPHARGLRVLRMIKPLDPAVLIPPVLIFRDQFELRTTPCGLPLS